MRMGWWNLVLLAAVNGSAFFFGWAVRSRFDTLPTACPECPRAVLDVADCLDAANCEPLLEASERSSGLTCKAAVEAAVEAARSEEEIEDWCEIEEAEKNWLAVYRNFKTRF